MSTDVDVPDYDLDILIETYSTQKDSALSNHQRQLLSALNELRAYRYIAPKKPGRPAGS
jgi:hypothetical protein